MPKILLTDVYLKSISHVPSGRLEVTDLRSPGLVFRVTDKGAKSWSFKYRDKTSGRVERLSLGRYPDVSLADARNAADAHRQNVANGGNPRNEQRKARIAERGATRFAALVERYLREVVEKRTPKSADVQRSYLAAPKKEWKDKRAKDIERADVIAFLAMRAEKTPVAANRTLTALGQLFAWAADEGYVDASPIVRIPKPGIEKARERVLVDDEMAVLWRAFDTLPEPMALAFRFLALTGQRPGEVIGLTLGELYEMGKPNAARWEIPGERTKNGRRHVVPLTGDTLAIIKRALALKPDDDDSPWVFVSPRKAKHPFDRQSFARAIKRLVVTLEATPETEEAVERLKADPPTPHDLRRTVVTGLGRLGFTREHVKALVNHAEGDVTERHYDRYDRMPEKRRALEAWERYVHHILGEATEDKVVPFKALEEA